MGLHQVLSCSLESGWGEKSYYLFAFKHISSSSGENNQILLPPFKSQVKIKEPNALESQ